MKLVPLGEVCTVINGGTPDTKVSKYWGGKHAWITPAEMGNLKSPFLGASKRTLTDEGLNNSSAQLVPILSVIMSSRAPIGHLVINEIPMACNQGCKGLIPNKNLNFKYLYYFLYANKQHLNELGSGTTFAEISGSKLKTVLIPLPSLEKQQEIVEKLDVAFFEIDLLEGNLFERESVIAEITAEKLDQIFRKKTEGTNNSQQVALSEIARVINGRAYNQSELLKQGKYPVLRVGNFFSNRSWYYSDLELDKDKYCDDGDLLYAWSASFGPRIWDGGKVIYHYHIWKVEEKKEMVLRDWLYWWFLWDVNQIKEAHGTGSTMMHVTKGAMENRLVQLPSLEIQSQQVREITELQLATQKIESNYKDLAKKLFELRNAVLASAFEEEVA
jgi:restriction endonuclease S subunit